MQNILCVWIWWPRIHKDAKEYFQSYDVCKRVGNPSRRYFCPQILGITKDMMSRGPQVADMEYQGIA
jgi:hypothetical protein